jgi:3-deoxy-D-manno-octulosonate 8-phosphate phosphatase (KDO 8-P phosphatase)
MRSPPSAGFFVDVQADSLQTLCDQKRRVLLLYWRDSNRRPPMNTIQPSPAAHDDTRARASRLKLMAFDVDGVLSDGSLFYTDAGVEIKAFNTLDGLGLNLLQRAGINVAIITGRKARCVELRMQNLGITRLYQGVSNKLEALHQLLTELGIGADEAGYMGDDIVDLRIMDACGFSAAPADCDARVRPYARMLAGKNGGRGAVREVCEFILEAQGKLDAALAPYLPVPAK